MNVHKRLKIVLITGLSNSWIADLVARLKDIPEVEFENVICWQQKQDRVKKIKKNIKKHGIIYIPWRIMKFINNIVFKKINVFFDRILYLPKIEENLFSICSNHGIKIYEINDIHSDEGINLLSSLNCELLVVCGTGILKRTVFELPKIGTINLHQGEVPKYKGAPPGFWELWNNERQAGVTVHFIDEGVDTGDIILQETVPIFDYDNYSSINKKLSEISLSIYPEAVRQIATGKNRRIKQSNGIGKQYFLPTLKQHLQLYLRIKKRQFDFFVLIKNLTKKILFPIGLLIIYLRDIYLCSRGKKFLSVLYYHRVTDICQDGMTSGVEAFEEQIRFLKKHYQILSASELESYLNQNENYKRKNCVLITFDDGYEDNYINALPILKKYNCPAIFFISTSYIGNNNQFEHDSELQPLLNFKKMDWEQLKDAMQHDIEIGVHSDIHLNLDKISYHEGVHQIGRAHV